MKVLIITEANEKVASGHLFESLVLAHVCMANGHDVLLLINNGMQPLLKDRIDVPYQEYQEPLTFRSVENVWKVDSYDCIVTDLRQIEDSFLIQLKECQGAKAIPILCIDEFGHRHLTCDVIINPMVDPQYWEYPDEDESCTVYAGPEYLILPESLSEYHRKEKNIRQKIQIITVSMGGVDPQGHALKLVRWLPELLPDCNITFVCGGGFVEIEELKSIGRDNPNIQVVQNIDYLYELFFESDLAFCAGGNTLHELAAIGTPAIVIPSMPHEVNNGLAFQKFGTCITVKNYLSYESDDVRRVLQRTFSQRSRVRMSYFGKKVVDGCGVYKVINIINNFAEE